MLNQTGIKKETMVSPVQILANVEHQVSVGCLVDDAAGTTVGSKKIVKAGTPLKVDLGNLATAAGKPTVTPAAETPGEDGAGTTTDMNAVLLHDVDVTSGDANGTALIFGFVNINRLESDVQAMVKAGTFGMITFLKA